MSDQFGQMLHVQLALDNKARDHQQQKKAFKIVNEGIYIQRPSGFEVLDSGNASESAASN